VRDAHHTGVPYGTIDHARLVRQLTFDDDELVLAEGNVQTAESLLVARALMNPTVYSHHVARISKAMLRRAAETLLSNTDATADDLRRWDDPELLVALRDCEETADLVRRIDCRTLLKRALWAELDDVPERLLAAEYEDARGYELEIADRAGVPASSVVVDVPGAPSMTESSTRVLVNGERRQLDRQSPLVDALRAAQRSQWRMGVYAPADHTDEVGRAAVEALGLDIDGGLVSELRGVPTTLGDFAED
jgi:HD superfamily phosphohydrolase